MNKWKWLFTAAVASAVLAALQHTSLAFLSIDTADFFSGLAVGLVIGSLISYTIEHRG